MTRDAIDAAVEAFNGTAGPPNYRVSMERAIAAYEAFPAPETDKPVPYPGRIKITDYHGLLEGSGPAPTPRRRAGGQDRMSEQVNPDERERELVPIELEGTTDYGRPRILNAVHREVPCAREIVSYVPRAIFDAYLTAERKLREEAQREAIRSRERADELEDERDGEGERRQHAERLLNEPGTVGIARLERDQERERLEAAERDLETERERLEAAQSRRNGNLNDVEDMAQGRLTPEQVDAHDSQRWTPALQATADLRARAESAERQLALASLAVRRGTEVERLREALDALRAAEDWGQGAYEFIERVQTWTGSDPDEIHEILQAAPDTEGAVLKLVAALAALSPPPETEAQ